VLLAGLLVGFVAMHTLGHAGMSHASGIQPRQMWSTATLAAAPHTAAMVMDDLGTASGAAVTRDGFDIARLSVRTGGGYAGEGWSVCLAVLATALLVLLMGWLRSRPRGPRLRAGGESSGPPQAPRGPPQPLALRLVDVSVVRR